ncbi:MULTISPECIES: hypothetical protein [Streptomyces]|uniref:hypothetical protein n=1 Tax=Streptomyces TaxID=1883 RepID=UPI001F461CBA|nr:hypothetical protein [Streptomyces sp. CB02120-2]
MTATLDHVARLLDSPPAPAVPGQLAVEVVPATLAAAFAARTRATEDGHRVWTAGVNSRGVGRFQHAGRTYTAQQAAHAVRTGRQPVGQVRPACDVPGCCEPEHVDDRLTRQRDRAALASITGMGHRAPSCDHDQATHGRHRADGRKYCNACNSAPKKPRCEHGNPQCEAAETIRPYPCGWRCDEHQPARTRPY